MFGIFFLGVLLSSHSKIPCYVLFFRQDPEIISSLLPALPVFVRVTIASENHNRTARIQSRHQQSSHELTVEPMNVSKIGL